MFSLNSIPPQLVLPLAQLGSACSVIRALAAQHLPSTHQRVNQAIIVTAAAERPVTLNDVTETIETSLQELGMDELARDIKLETLAPLLDTKRIETLLSNEDTGHRGSTAYLSSDSFFKNKTGFSENELWDVTFGGRPARQQFHMTLQHFGAMSEGNWLSRTFSQQIRGFKTKRSTSATGIGSHSPEETYTPLRGFKDALLGRVSASQKSAGRQSDRFKTMLADYNDSPDTQEKLKVAFAEGYTAHDKKEVDGASLWVRRLVRLAWYGLFVWLLLQIVQSYGAMGGKDGRLAGSSAQRGSTSSGVKPATFPPDPSSIIPDMKLNVLKGDRYEVNPEDIHVCFSDIKGVEEAKQELQDVVEFLRDPGKFKALGAKLPKGVLLVGPPGIGKTLLARAVAGEAAVPFFHASGSEFDEIFVGTGAKRVRQLFDAAKMRAPCVIFIDEIDTVGAKRTSSQIHPYANQTINQLLSEMDGFQQNDGVIVLGATNRRDNLDKALLRPGRFDVEVRVYPPDLKGRVEIIEHYLSKVKAGAGLDVYKLAKGTTGCTGADLENLVNQAALKAAMDAATSVTMEHLEYAQDKILMGPAKKSKIPDEDTNRCTAYHEAGHTLVAYFTKDATPLHKVTIVPRGTSLGHTSFIPDKEEYNLTRSQLLARMDVAMGGRVGEEIMMGPDKVTTGASSDFHQATAIATAMVKKFGMSDKVGVRVFDEEEVESGMSFLKVNDLSPQMAELIDNEIKRLLQESYERAKALVKAHQKEHKALASSLLIHETLKREEILAIIAGKPSRHV